MQHTGKNQAGYTVAVATRTCLFWTKTGHEDLAKGTEL